MRAYSQTARGEAGALSLMTAIEPSASKITVPEVCLSGFGSSVAVCSSIPIVIAPLFVDSYLGINDDF